MNLQIEFKTLASTFRNDFAWEWQCGHYNSIRETIKQIFSPFIIETGGYLLDIVTSFWEKDRNDFVLSCAKSTGDMATAYAPSHPPKFLVTAGGIYPPHSNNPPCLSCQRAGSAGPGKPKELGVPDEVLPIHESLVNAFGEERFVAIRTERAKRISEALFNDTDVGICQIMFRGHILGFGAVPQNSTRLIHYPAVWNFPCRIDPKDLTEFELNFNGDKRTNYVWHRRCEVCSGSGFAKEHKVE